MFLMRFTKSCMVVIPALFASYAWADFVPLTTGVNTGYINAGNNTCTQPGRYSVVNNLSDLNSACGFNTSLAPVTGTNFTLFDGNNASNYYQGLNTGPLAGVVWAETTNIPFGGAFSVWVADVDNAKFPAVNTDMNPAVLALYANGVQVGTNFPVPPSAGNPASWSLWSETLSPTAGPVTLEILDVNTQVTTPGDDFALDTLFATPEPSELPVALLIASAGAFVIWRRTRRAQ
jgi:hypothetical protein